MDMEGNQTSVTDFVLVGFTTDPFLRIIFFVLFLASYILTLTGNLGLMSLIYLDSRLHTPMYFFVGSLSFLDVWYSSVYTPRILSDCVSTNNHMSLAGCAAQFFFSAGLTFSECFLLAFMAYDRFVAICNPLLYATAMPKKLCVQLVVGSYVAGFANSIVHTGNTFRLHFCGSNIVNHYFCDVLPLVKMACDDTRVHELILKATIGCNLLVTTAIIVSSYIGIGATIVRIRSAEGRRKAFFTCSAHLVSVTLFYGSILIMYSRSNSQHTPNWDKVNALFYTVINPLVNPFIYSLRNKDVKAASKKVWGIQLVVGAYVVGFSNAIVYTGNTLRLHFCDNNVINHYFSDGPPFLKMSCNDTGVHELIAATVLRSNLLVPRAIVVSSYVGIGAAIVNIQSAAGRCKAFFTCSARLMSVSLFYGSILIMYHRPSFHHTPNWDKANALFYMVVNSLANPFMYSLRNKDVKATLKKVSRRFIAPK